MAVASQIAKSHEDVLHAIGELEQRAIIEEGSCNIGEEARIVRYR